MNRWITATAAAGLLAAAPAPPPPVTPAAGLAPPAAAPDPSPVLDRPDDLPRTDPVRFLTATAARVKAEVRSFRAVLHKQERVAGELHDPEVVRISLRAEPYAVRVLWDAGAQKVLRTPVEGLIYAAGANQGRMTVWLPTGWPLTTLSVAPTDAQARAAARFSITEAGLTHAADRTVRAWTAARAAGRLRFAYHGVRPTPECGGRPCHQFERTCDPPEVDRFLMADPETDAAARPADAVGRVRVFIDAETGLQVGTEARRADGELVGSYFFRAVERNPAFGPAEFTPAAFAK